MNVLPEVLTKEQAIAAMRSGKKVTHRHFDSNEWMTMIGNAIRLEDGVTCTQEEFWNWRKDESWNTDYYIVNETK